MLKKQLSRSNTAIHGFWIPALPAGMTRYLDAWTF